MQNALLPARPQAASAADDGPSVQKEGTIRDPDDAKRQQAAHEQELAAAVTKAVSRARYADQADHALEQEALETKLRRATARAVAAEQQLAELKERQRHEEREWQAVAKVLEAEKKLLQDQQQ